MVQRLGGNGLIYGFYPVPEGASPFGPFFNHNHFAAYLEMAFPIALGMFFWWLTRQAPEPVAEETAPEPRSGLRVFFARRLREGPDVVARLGLSGFASVVMLAALVLSGSRGAVMSLGAACLVYGALMAWRGQLGRREAFAGAAVVAAALALLLWVGPGHLGEMTRKLERVTEFETEPSLSARVTGWRATLGIVADHPLIGTGLGTFPDAWLRHYPPGTANVWKETHNDYLQVAAETGLVGAALLAWGLVVMMRRHLFGAVGPNRSGKPQPALRHGMAIGLLSLLFHSLVDFSLQVGAISLLFVILSATLMSENRRQADN
jgi:O-antigen ligase